MSDESEQLTIDSATGLDIQMAIAGPGARSYAFIIDWHFRALIAGAWWIAAAYLIVGSLAPADNKAYFFVVALPAVLIYTLYHPVLETLLHGRTPGKRIAGVKIVTRTGLTPGVAALLIRNVFRLLDSMPVMYCVGLVSTLFTSQHVRIGDLAAGTLLVYERADHRKLKDDFSTPSSAGTHVDPRVLEVADDLIARWPELDRSTRRELATKVLARIDPQAALPEDDKALREMLRNRLAG